MRILLSNDDGYFAPGLAILADALSQFGSITVVAPERDRSGSSNSLTLDRPLSVRRSPAGAWYVNGTPTDCVHLAVTGLLDFVPDMIVSGINDGANMGDDTIYSGTVAAAMEGFLLGIPSMAVSLASVVALLDSVRLGRRMDFDIEIAVRLYWRGVRLVPVPTAVIYPPGGTSNFRVLADNALITKLHTKLVFGMLLRLPLLATRRLSAGLHWSELGERGGVLGDDGLLGQLRGGDADALEAVGDDAVAGGQQADEQVHRRDAGAVVLARPQVGLALPLARASSPLPAFETAVERAVETALDSVGYAVGASVLASVLALLLAAAAGRSARLRGAVRPEVVGPAGRRR